MNRRPARRGTRRKRHERSSACCHRGAVMTATPDPVWPVLVLALIQLVDAAPCVKPVGFVAACFEAVKWPRRLWWLMPWLKLAAVAGLIAGIFIPYLTAVTCSALISISSWRSRCTSALRRSSRRSPLLRWNGRPEFRRACPSFCATDEIPRSSSGVNARQAQTTAAGRTQVILCDQSNSRRGAACSARTRPVVISATK
jgi:hypothetical protein